MKSKSQTIFISFIGILIVGIALLMVRSHLAQKTAERYLADMQLGANQMTYSAIAAPLWSDGVILYQVQFPQLNIHHPIDKIIVHKQNNKISMRLLGVSINIIDLLRGQNPLILKKRLSDYKPKTDAFKYPIESLGLCGIDSIKADITVRLKEEENNITLYASLDIKGQANLYLTGFLAKSFQLDDLMRHPLLLTQIEITKPVLTIKDKGLIQRYNAYLTAVDMPVIQSDKQTVKITPNNSIILNQVITMEQ